MSESQADAPILRELRGHVALLTLNRPDNRNSMTPEVLDAYADAIEWVKAPPTARCLVLTGKGRCFCAGADLRVELQRGGEDARASLPHEQSFAMYEPFLSTLSLEIPVIGALNGHTVGGGLGLALMCDIRIGAREAKYGANFVKLGIHPGMSISYLLPRLVGRPHAAELLFTGRLIKGDEAASMGLLNRAIDAAEVLPEALAMAAQIAANAPIAVQLTKRTLLRGLTQSIRDAAYHEAGEQAATLVTEDAAEGIAALLDKRTPSFLGK